MTFVIGFLTFVLVLNCLMLMLLVLIQLPKKEAGPGVAFGGGAADALFGAGSGNALTKITKYTATSFIGLAVVLSFLNSQLSQQRNLKLDEAVQRQANAAAAANAANAPTNPLALPPAATGMTSLVQSLVVTNQAEATNAPATNAPAEATTPEAPEEPTPAEPAPAEPTPAPTTPNP